MSAKTELVGSKILECPLRDFFADIDNETNQGQEDQGLFSINDLVLALLQLKKHNLRNCTFIVIRLVQIDRMRSPETRK